MNLPYLFIMLSHVSPATTRCQRLHAAGCPGWVTVGGHVVSMVGTVRLQVTMGSRVEYVVFWGVVMGTELAVVEMMGEELEVVVTMEELVDDLSPTPTQ